MHIRNLCTCLILGLAVVACDHAAPEPFAPDTECGELVCGAAGKADGQSLQAALLVDEDVPFVYRDFIGHSIEDERFITGHVQLFVFGDPLPVAEPSPFFTDTEGDFELQPVFIRLSMPWVRDPSVMLEREYLGLAQTWDNGKTYSFTNFGGHASLIDASRPDAIALFNESYDFEAQAGNPTWRTDIEWAVTPQFGTGDDGQLHLTHLGQSFREEINFAHHSFSVFIDGQ